MMSHTFYGTEIIALLFSSPPVVTVPDSSVYTLTHSSLKIKNRKLFCTNCFARTIFATHCSVKTINETWENNDCNDETMVCYRVFNLEKAATVIVDYSYYYLLLLL